jgi:hypothetical protein
MTCNPGRKYLLGGIADEALKINGLSVRRVLAAKPARTVASELHARMARIRDSQGEIDIRAFNARFDRSFLIEDPWMLVEGWGPCLMEEAATAFGAPTRRIALGKAAELAGVSIMGRPHTAGTDAATALQVHSWIRAHEVGNSIHSEPLIRKALALGGRLAKSVRIGCEICENFGAHIGEHGYYKLDEFYAFMD